MGYEEWLGTVNAFLAQLGDSVVQQLPGVFGALGLIFIGWLVARLLRALIVRVSRSFDWLLKNDVAREDMRRVGVRMTGGEVIGSLVYWTVLLLFLAAATELLGLPVIATWFGSLVYFLPRILVGVIIVLAGLLFGRLAGNAVERAAGAANLARAGTLGRAIHGVIILVAVVTAGEQVGIDTALLTATITIVVGAVIGGAALSFALGSRVHAGNIIAVHYLKQVYQIGQTVKLGDAEGKIIDFTSSAVLLDTPDGRLMLPAEDFSRRASLLLSGE